MDVHRPRHTIRLSQRFCSINPMSVNCAVRHPSQRFAARSSATIVEDLHALSMVRKLIAGEIPNERLSDTLG